MVFYFIFVYTSGRFLFMKKWTMIALATVFAANAGASQIQWEVDSSYWISGTFYIYGLGETSTDTTFGDGGFDPVTKTLTSTGGTVFSLFPSNKFQMLFEHEEIWKLSDYLDSHDAIGLIWKLEDENDFFQTWVVVTVDESNEHYMYDIFYPDPSHSTYPNDLDYYVRWLYVTQTSDYAAQAEEDDDRGYNWAVWHHNISLNPPVQYAVAPEPATGLLVLSGAALVMLRRRRR